jgi:serine/threonine protein kinase
MSDVNNGYPLDISNVWPEWHIEGTPLGRGSFGVVYKAVRKDLDVESKAAIKVISIPNDPSEIASLRSEGLDEKATRTYLQGIMKDFVSEIQVMESLKGGQNIVCVEDYKVVEKAEGIGWDIYIRMELLIQRIFLPAQKNLFLLQGVC